METVTPASASGQSSLAPKLMRPRSPLVSYLQALTMPEAMSLVMTVVTTGSELVQPNLMRASSIMTPPPLTRS